MSATELCVDDEGDVTALLRFHLSRAGCRVFTAASGRQALEIVAKETPDLVLLDLMLPDIDGFGVCEILRSKSETARIPIVILSAWTTNDARNLGLELGALDFITKPFVPRDVLRRIEQLLEGAPAKA
jgi:two-component system alkaline phosphatase synthesis response regulator PhoP